MTTDDAPGRRRLRVEDVQRRPGLAFLATIVTITLLMTVGQAFASGLPEPVAHGLSHALVGAPLAVLVVAALRWWPPARTTPPGRIARRVVVVGLSGMVLGQFLEVAGARVDEPGALAVEGMAHVAGQVVTMLSLFAAAAGGALALVAATRDRAVPRWVAALAAVLGAGILTMMVIGDPNA